jgi:hypothetical protein
MNSNQILFDAAQRCIADGILSASGYREQLMNVKSTQFWDTLRIFWSIYENDPRVCLISCITEHGQVNMELYLYIFTLF